LGGGGSEGFQSTYLSYDKFLLNSTLLGQSNLIAYLYDFEDKHDIVCWGFD